ncbi:hypothetical protein FF125_06250 [Aureibaculum algae]|uniref:Uncharacterized protein n=1 Tax=Aureibaculum algae TaxID=2584122 RepID=A0A5B7TNU5_9FLAO|nr:hypothetical protein [Aureibaculum algae]QCX38048.1 hypothetical protein FF125_06250 [Aureibaculum algae]
MKKEVEKDIEGIIEYCHQFAEYMLNKGKEYYPFGAQIKNDGELVGVGIENEETDFPESQKLIDGMTMEFEKLFAEGQIKAYVITYDVRIPINDLGEKSDAICMDITHAESDEKPRYYFTYSWNKNEELIFGQSFGMNR